VTNDIKTNVHKNLTVDQIRAINDDTSEIAQCLFKSLKNTYSFNSKIDASEFVQTLIEQGKNTWAKNIVIDGNKVTLIPTALSFLNGECIIDIIAKTKGLKIE